MAGKHSSSITPRTTPPLPPLSPLLHHLPLHISFRSAPPQTLAPAPTTPSSPPSRNSSPLAQKPRVLLDDTVASASEQGVKKLDDMIWKTETKRLYGDPFLPPLRVYVYEMPKKFTYDLLTLFRNTFRETSNLTSNGSPVHRLIEQVPHCIKESTEGLGHLLP